MMLIITATDTYYSFKYHIYFGLFYSGCCCVLLNFVFFVQNKVEEDKERHNSIITQYTYLFCLMSTDRVIDNNNNKIGESKFNARNQCRLLYNMSTDLFSFQKDSIFRCYCCCFVTQNIHLYNIQYTFIIYCNLVQFVYFYICLKEKTFFYTHLTHLLTDFLSIN